MRFSKLQATGNDFILVDARAKAAEWPKLAQAMVLSVHHKSLELISQCSLYLSMTGM